MFYKEVGVKIKFTSPYKQMSKRNYVSFRGTDWSLYASENRVVIEQTAENLTNEPLVLSWDILNELQKIMKEGIE